jgi:hypothetical protein
LTKQKWVIDLRLRAVGKLLILLLFVGCINNIPELPKGYLQPDKMGDVLLDMHLIEGARSGTLVMGDTNKLPDYYARIYAKHGVDEQTFKESMYWYTKHPELLKKIYEKVVIDLTKIETEVKQNIKNTADEGKLD